MKKKDFKQIYNLILDDFRQGKLYEVDFIDGLVAFHDIGDGGQREISLVKNNVSSIIGVWDLYEHENHLMLLANNIHYLVKDYLGEGILLEINGQSKFWKCVL